MSFSLTPSDCPFYCSNLDITECHYTPFHNDSKISTQDGPNDLEVIGRVCKESCQLANKVDSLCTQPCPYSNKSGLALGFRSII